MTLINSNIYWGQRISKYCIGCQNLMMMIIRWEILVGIKFNHDYNCHHYYDCCVLHIVPLHIFNCFIIFLIAPYIMFICSYDFTCMFWYAINAFYCIFKFVNTWSEKKINKCTLLDKSFKDFFSTSCHTKITVNINNLSIQEWKHITFLTSCEISYV